MAKLILNDVQNLENSESAKNTININSANIEAAVERTLFRDGEPPNQMLADLDMNSNRILNLPAPIDPTEPLRRKEGEFLTGISDVILLNQAVEDAQEAATIATDQSALAKKWATNPEDVAVTTPPDQYSAFHWANKASDFATVARYREKLTKDKTWYVSHAAPNNGSNPAGSDETGDGSEANPWHSVTKAQHYIMTSVDCNGFNPVIAMYSGTYTPENYPGGFTPPGFFTWGGLPDHPVMGTNVVAVGGAFMELCEPLIGKQITGGGNLILTSRGPANRAGDDVVIVTDPACISVLHMGVVTVSSMTLVSRTNSNLYATQKGVIAIGNNLNFAGAAEACMRAETGGSIIQIGQVGLRGGSKNFAYAGDMSEVTMYGPVHFQYDGLGHFDAAHIVGGPHHFSDAFIVCARGGQAAWSIHSDNFYGQINPVSYRYKVATAGQLYGITGINGKPATDTEPAWLPVGGQLYNDQGYVNGVSTSTYGMAF